MIGSHPRVIAPPEPQFLPLLIPETPGAPVDPVQIIDAIERHSHFRFWDWSLEGRRPPSDREWTYRDVIDWLMREYARDHGKSEITHFVDNTGMHVLHAKRLSQEFQGLRFVNIVRDGRAVVASTLQTDFGGDDIVSAAEAWVFFVGVAYIAEHQLPEVPFLQIRYEDLVTDPSKTFRAIADHLDLEFTPEILDSTGLTAARATQKYHRLVGQLPDPSRIDRWRRLLSPRQIEIFELITGDLLDMLGYAPLYAKPRAMTVLERVRRALFMPFRKIYNRAHFRLRIFRYAK